MPAVALVEDLPSPLAPAEVEAVPVALGVLGLEVGLETGREVPPIGMKPLGISSLGGQ